ncbi:hypothetical protein ACTMTI_48095 [Nonomuraea sp. H19]|uniref:hypothetical protein n=1 Tax=Nonomuraea sp. H19 TaxID=3452206 RepID=UPI003F8C9C87
MLFAKPLAAGAIGATFLVAPFAGESLAATTPAVYAEKPAQTASRVSIKASVTPRKVAAGQPYRVAGVEDGTTATVKSPQGTTYKVALENGKATKNLTVPRTTRPGSYRVGITIGGKTATAEFTVVQRGDRD